MGAVAAGTSTKRSGRSIVRAIYSGGDVTILPFSVTMSNSYATGGDTGFAAAAGLGQYTVDFTWIRPQNGYTFVHDATADKLIAYTSGGTQTTSSTDLSGFTVRGLAFVR